jgi:hypothetical protein
MRARLSALAFASLGCCQPAPVLLREPVPPPSPAPTPVGSAQPQVTPAPGLPNAQEPPLSGATLRLVAKLDCDAHVFAVSEQRFVGCGTDLIPVADDGSLKPGVTVSRGLRLDAPGLASPRVVEMAGKWPDVAWAATSEVSGNGNSRYLRLFRWKRDRWVATGQGAELAGPLNEVVFPWQGDGMVALVPAPFGPTRSLAVAEGTPAVPALTRATQSRADHESYPCTHSLIAPETSVELAPGDVMVFAGQLCGVPSAPNGDAIQARNLGVERLRSGQKRGELMLIPVPDDVPADAVWHVDGAAALSPTDALIAASSSAGHFSLTRWDGESWSSIAAPFSSVSGMWAQAGTFWVTESKGNAWLRRSDRWSRIEWQADEEPDGPQGDELTQIIGMGAGRTWVVRRSERGGQTTSHIYQVELREKAP